MTEKTLEDLHPEDVEHARAYVKDFLEATYASDHSRAVARVLDALLPTPPPLPTLADMTEEEGQECRWMQCDVTDFRRKMVLATTRDEDGDAGLIAPDGGIYWLRPGRVTPRPDLPRLEWPDDK